MSEFGALGLVLIISPSSELRIVHRFLDGLLVLQGIFCQNFKFFLNQFVGLACIEHWFWWFWSSNLTWLGPISSRSVLGNILDPFGALVRVPCNPPGIHMDSWWWSKRVNVERAAHLVTVRSIYGAGFWGWWGHFPKLKEGKMKVEVGRAGVLV